MYNTMLNQEPIDLEAQKELLDLNEHIKRTQAHKLAYFKKAYMNAWDDRAKNFIMQMEHLAMENVELRITVAQMKWLQGIGGKYEWPAIVYIPKPISIQVPLVV